jgi:hypothetical protein
MFVLTPLCQYFVKQSFVIEIMKMRKSNVGLNIAEMRKCHKLSNGLC